MSTGDSIVKGLKVVATHFGKSERQVRRWVKDPSFPRLSGRRFDLLQMQAWLDERDGRPAARPRSENPRQPELVEQRGKSFQEERLKKAQAEKAEMELEQLKGETIKTVVLEDLLASRALVYRQGVMELARSLPPLLPLSPEARREAEAIITTKVRELLAKVLRSLILADGQTLKWEKDGGAPPGPELQKTDQVG